jgi:acetoin utilization protein AcuB
MSTQVVTVFADDDRGDALVKMSEHGVRRLPVVKTVSGETLVIGVVSDRDIRLAAQSPFLHGEVRGIVDQLRELRVGDVMTTDPVTVFPDAPVASAAELMLRNKIGGLPVVDQEEGKPYLVGMLTRSDLLRHLIRLETAVDEPEPSSPAAVEGD